MLQIQGLTKSFGGRTLFAGVNLHLPERGVVGLIGPNGAGKTTLMQILCGNATADEGQIHVPKGAAVGVLGQEVESEITGSVLDTVLQGFADVLSVETRLAELGEQAARGEDVDKVLEEMARVQAEFEAADGFRLVERGKTILHGLGFSDDQIRERAEKLSGGWRMRAVLGKLLLESPPVLLMDEPTNHLDIDSLIWLEAFIRDYEGLVVLTSHDRAFLDRVAAGIVSLEDGTARYYPGNYSAFERARAESLEQMQARAASMEKERERMQKFIDRFKAKATKARQAGSKAKQLERLEKELEAEQPVVTHRKRMNMDIAEAPRSARRVIEVDGLTKRFGSLTVFDGVDWRLERGQKVALMGPNGAGKSTLLKLLAGVLDPDAGEIRFGGRVEAAYYAQHHLESMDPEVSVYDTMANAHPDATIGEIRGLLGAFLFPGDEVKKKVGVLSGGERARLSMAKLFLRPRNLLLLDEPTNHLDMESREVVADALDGFDGTLVVVSHDRAFLDTFADHVVALHPGRFESYPGNTAQYEYHLREQQQAAAGQRASGKAKATAASNVAAPGKDTGGKAAKAGGKGKGNGKHKGGGDEFKARKKLRSKFRACVKDVKTAEAEVDRLQAQLGDPAMADDHEALWAAQEALDKARAAADKQVARWEDLIAEGERVGLDLLAETDQV